MEVKVVRYRKGENIQNEYSLYEYHIRSTPRATLLFIAGDKNAIVSESQQFMPILHSLFSDLLKKREGIRREGKRFVLYSARQMIRDRFRNESLDDALVVFHMLAPESCDRILSLYSRSLENTTVLAIEPNENNFDSWVEKYPQMVML